MARSSAYISVPRVLLSGLALPESPRWHYGRLWFSKWGADEIVAVDLEGNSEVMGRGPEGEGWAVNWLPDERMLITGSELVRVEHDGSRVRHADLSHLSPHGWSEITIDGRGNIYVNDHIGQQDPHCCRVVRCTAHCFRHRRGRHPVESTVWADGVGPDGICLDTDGCI